MVGIAPAVTPAGYHRLLDWIDAGYDAGMEWIGRRRHAYENPEHVMEGTRSVVMVGLNYHDGTPHAPGARVSRYAWGKADYHDVMREMLRALANRLHEKCPEARTRVVTDTAPLLERDFARLAGMGWSARNTMLISPHAGSWFFLGALLTDVLLEPNLPFTADHCGTCTRCLDACPTDAFPKPGVLDAARCISYLTIEHRKLPIPEPLRYGIGDWVFGCDICQDVCPWNRFAPQQAVPAFAVVSDLNPIDCRQLLRMNEAEFQSRFAGTPLIRAGRAGLLRNAAVVLGNQKCLTAEPELIHALQELEPLIRGAAAWALGQLGTADSCRSLQERLAVETDPTVRGEIREALLSAGVGNTGT